VLDEGVRALMATKQFLNVQLHKQEMSANKIRLYLILKEYPSTITEVTYQGNKHLKPEEFETVSGLRKGPPHSPIVVRMG
jgi:outer membrane protein assembly factor BamA